MLEEGGDSDTYAIRKTDLERRVPRSILFGKKEKSIGICPVNETKRVGFNEGH